MAQDNPFARIFKHPVPSVRLGIIKAGQPSDPLEIEFISADPKDTSYDCISYDRSKDAGSVDIEVEGKSLTIPSVLATALKSFRKADRPHTTWADLLIGSTVQDRSTQAAEMTTVFQHAEKVVAWLGPGDAHTDLALDTLRNLANRWHQARLHSNFPEYSNRATQKQMMDAHSFLMSKPLDDLQLSNSVLWKSLQDVFDSTYFETTQSIPEIVLAKKAVVGIGDRSISWEDFNAALMAYLILVPSNAMQFSPKFLDAYQRISRLELATLRKRNGDSLELAAMLKDARRTSCSDPREIIFSMLPIITPCERTKGMLGRPAALDADYAQSLPEVIKEACKYIIEERQDVMLWSFGERPPCGRKITALPSWAPDLTTPTPLDVVYTTSNAASGLRAWADPLSSNKKLHVDAEGGLHAEAHALDRITYVSEAFTKANCRRLAFTSWEQASQLLLPNETRPAQTEKIWRTLCLNTGEGMGETVRDSKPPGADIGESFMSLIAEEKVLATLNCTTADLMAAPPDLMKRAAANAEVQLWKNLCGRSQQFEALLQRNAAGRRFFQTESGKVGLTAIEDVPPSEQDNDADGPRLPNFDEALSDPLGQVMLSSFQKFLEKKDPSMARIMAQAKSGTLLSGQRTPGVRSGDLVVAIVGGYQPYVLRPVDPLANSRTGEHQVLLDADSKYTYVGDCYLHGVMDGECFREKTWYGGTRYKQNVEKVDIVIV